MIDASGVYAMSSGCQNQVARWRWFIEYREAHVCSSRYQYFIASRNEETACSPRLGEIQNCVRVFELRRRVCDCSDWCKATDGATDDSVMPVPAPSWPAGLVKHNFGDLQVLCRLWSMAFGESGFEEPVPQWCLSTKPK